MNILKSLHWVYIWMNFMTCQLYLNEAIILKRQTKKNQAKCNLNKQIFRSQRYYFSICYVCAHVIFFL